MINRILKLSYVALIFLVACDKNENNLSLELHSDIILDKRIPIYYNGNFTNWEVNTNHKNDLNEIHIHVPDSINIPVNSKIKMGYIDFLRTVGIRIDPGSSTEYFSSKNVIQIELNEEIIIELEETDPLLVDTVLRIMKQVIKNDSINISE